MRKRIYAHIIVLLVTLIASFDVNQWIYAKEETIVPSAIRYSENNKQAEILFNVNGVDEEEYELISIVSDSDSEIVYDGTQDTSEDIVYIVKENGDYSFTVTYIEKQKEEIEEKSIVLTASVTEIITTEETYELIEISDSEEVSENTETSESEQDTTISTLSDSKVKETLASTKATDVVEINSTNFPSPVFREKITELTGKKEGDWLTDEDIEKVTEIKIEGQANGTYLGDVSVTGIEYFTNLESLTIAYTFISKIDVSLLSNLKKLNAHHNSYLSEIILPIETKNLISYKAYTTILSGTIDVSMYPNLQELVVGNVSGITEIDVTGCKNLERIDALNDSNLEKIEGLENCTSLTTLQLNGTKIQYLDVSNLKNLTTLDAYNNTNLQNITGLNDKTNLTTLYVHNTSLTLLDVSGCIALQTLHAYNCANLSNIVLDNTIAITNLQVYASNLTSLDLSNHDNLTVLNVRNNPLAYVKLPSNISLTQFNANSLTTIEISEVYQDKDGSYWTNLQNLFPGIELKNISNVTVSGNASYNANTGKISGLAADADITITYTYDTNGESKYTMQPTIRITVNSSSIGITPFEIQAFDTDKSSDETISASDLRDKYGLVKSSGDSDFYPLTDAVSKGFKVTEEKYYYFNYDSGGFEDISQDTLINLSKGIGIYLYEFTVEDSTGLSLTGVSRFFVNQDVNYIERNNGYVLFYSINSLSISETQIAAYYYDANLFKNYIELQFACQGYKDNGGFDVAVASTKYDYTNFNLTTTSPTGLSPNNYELTAKVYDSSGVEKITKNFTLTIIENASSYEEDSVSTDNGASGYIIIPKSIELMKKEYLNTLTGEAEVKFANYVNATGANYQVSVDETFQITNSKDKSNEITVTVSSDDATGSSGNILNLGTFSTSNIDSGKKITFSTDPIIEVNDSKWEGSFTFYFTRNRK